MIDLGSLGGTLGASVWINNPGQITGVSKIAGDRTAHPFIWSRLDGMRDLLLHGSLGGTFGHPDWLNDKGEVAGLANIAGDQDGHAFLWRDGVITDLGTLGGDPGSEAAAINSKGQIVGSSGAFFITNGSGRGFLWEHGAMVDLNGLLVAGTTTCLTGCWLINDRGEIDCSGLASGTTAERAFVLIPCDEDHPALKGAITRRTLSGQYQGLPSMSYPKTTEFCFQSSAVNRSSHERDTSIGGWGHRFSRVERAVVIM